MITDGELIQYLKVTQALEIIEEIERTVSQFGGEDAEWHAIRTVKEKYQAFKDSF